MGRECISEEDEVRKREHQDKENEAKTWRTKRAGERGKDEG